ncbi:unnamed protein product [Leptidea sinapis]|uniref:Mucin-like domain-containing protein n=1 Tax=Leptidea sinapis TaxID=189913 RepID=A0A5E4R4W9_9NEOP|nr:unnamed protein product [Leptidea sinapis]
MKFTVIFITILSISRTWAIKTKIVDPKDKREAGASYPSSGHSSHSFQAPALGHGDASAISIGAGYSIGGAKPSYNYIPQESGAAYQSEGLPASGHASIQLQPYQLQQSHGGLVSNDLSQLMSQISEGLNSGALTLQSPGEGGVYQFEGQNGYGNQEYAIPQSAYGSPKLQEYAISDQGQGFPAAYTKGQYSFGEQGQGQSPAYAVGTKGLSSYATGPVLFAPSSSQPSQPALNYGSPNSGHAVSEGVSYSLGDSGHALPSYTLGNSGHSFGGSLKQYSGQYAAPGKSSFKPSAYLGSTVQNEGHGLSGFSGQYAAPSFGSYQSGGFSLGPAGHGASFGNAFPGFSGVSTKHISPSYLPAKSEGVGSLESIASAFSASGQLGQLHSGASFGSPSSSYVGSNHQAASAASPQYYVSSSKHAPGGGFGSGSVSYKSPVSGHSSLNSYSLGPKYSFGGHSSSRYSSPKDSHGAYSETSYNTIKYSEELKPRVH